MQLIWERFDKPGRIHGGGCGSVSCCNEAIAAAVALLLNLSQSIDQFSLQWLGLPACLLQAQCLLCHRKGPCVSLDPIGCRRGSWLIVLSHRVHGYKIFYVGGARGLCTCRSSVCAPYIRVPDQQTADQIIVVPLQAKKSEVGFLNASQEINLETPDYLT